MIKPRRKKNESNAAYNERATKLYYSNGYHIKEISKRLNIEEVEVYNYITTGRKITTEAEREEMIRLYNQGYTYSAIAKILGRSRACVTDRIKSPAKCKWQNSPDNLNDKQIKMIQDMAKEGMLVTAIAKEIGIRRGSVEYRLKHIGMPCKYKYVTKEEEKKFVRLYKKGLTHAEIGRICGRHRSTVYTHLHKLGYWRNKEK